MYFSGLAQILYSNGKKLLPEPAPSSLISVLKPMFLLAQPEGKVIHDLQELFPGFPAIRIPLVVAQAYLSEAEGNYREECTPILGGVYVDQNYRGQEIGEKLNHEIIKLAREKEYKNLYLSTDKMHSWYKKLGWETILEENYKNMRVFLMKFNLQISSRHLLL